MSSGFENANHPWGHPTNDDKKPIRKGDSDAIPAEKKPDEKPKDHSDENSDGTPIAPLPTPEP